MTRIRPEFAVHLLNPGGRAVAEAVAEDFSVLLTAIEGRGVAGRELAIVKTKLEEACFFAKRGLAVLPINQGPAS